MTSDKKPLDPKRSDALEELQKYAAKESKKIFSDKKKVDFDERNLASGSSDLIEKSDAELFPDEVEEYTEKERKPKVVVNDKHKKK